jgi:acyl-CoA synthetase (NDP forming)
MTVAPGGARVDVSAAVRKVEALLYPRNVVVVGANDRPGSWSARIWSSLVANGFEGPLFPVNPRRDEVYGVKCYPDIASLPEPPDHLVLVVPAPHVVAVLRDGHKAGARSATVISSGFEETGTEDGRRLAAELRQVIAETGLAVSGPNCLGNVCTKSRLATLSQDVPLAMRPGPVAVIGQSGGVSIFVNRELQDRGIDVGCIVSTGNEAGLTLADYIAFLATEPDAKVVLCYCEGVKDIAGFRAACSLARDNGKWVVLFKQGQSAEGQEAALAHTGSLAGNVEVFDALAADLGVIRVESFDDAIEITELLVHGAVPAGRRFAGLSLSGAFRGILLDAAARNGLTFPPLAPETVEKLKSLLFVGASIGNPLDGGFGVLTSEDVYVACAEALECDPSVDALIVQEELPRDRGEDRRGERYLRRIDNYAATRARKPVIYTTILSHGQNDYSRALRKELPHLAFLQEATNTLRAIDLCIRRDELVALAAQRVVPAPRTEPDAIQALRARVAAADGERVVLNEIESKALLREFGIAGPDERLCTTVEAAVTAAGSIGYPVVMKAVSAALSHKTEYGAVRLNLGDAAAVRAAWDEVRRNLAAKGFRDSLEGMLVAPYVTGGVDVVLGIHRDPEVGPAVMCGSGGILLELIRNVAFAVPPLTEAKAAYLLARTKLDTILRGYRGGARYDEPAAIAALMDLGRLAESLGDIVESLDINPLLVRPVGQGVVALDALVVLRQSAAPASAATGR